MNALASRRYPPWLLALAVVEIVAIFGAGVTLLVLINALSGPLTSERWAQVGGLWLGMPMLATALLIATGHGLIRRDRVRMGVVLTILPLVLLCLLILWANI